MEGEFQFILSFVIFLVLLLGGMKVPYAIAVPGLIYLLMTGGFNAVRALGVVTWGSLDSFTLTAVPLFLFMAELMQQSGLSSRIYRGLSKVASILPGGLLQTNILGCALFAAITGSSVCTAASIGSVALPQLIRRNYDRRLSSGSLAAGGTLGILYPPSIAMIVYGAFTNTSIVKLFMAGLFPGLLLTGMFMVYIAVRALMNSQIAPVEKRPRSLTEVLQAITDLLPFFVLIGGVMGSIYSGIATPVEAASCGCVLGFTFSLIWGDLNWAKFLLALSRTVQICGNLLFIIYAAYIFAYAISSAGVAERITSTVVDMHLSRLEFMGALFVLYTVLGCLVESVGMLVITVPLLTPTLISYNIDFIWFGVILVLYMEIGQISPPIGINLFVIQSVWDGKLSDIVRGTIPFHLIMFLMLILLTVWPAIALWLPMHGTQ